MAKQEDQFKKVISHAKEYGYIFGSSEIYDGLSAVYDYGQNGAELKKNIRDYWWKSMVQMHQNIVGLDAAIFMHPTTWKASGHVDAFSDPLIDNKDSKKRYRADVLVEDYAEKLNIKAEKEIAKAERRHNRVETYAKRYAAKEACSKALGTGFRKGVFWRDMGVINLPTGQPTMKLTGGALLRLQEITPVGMEAFIHLTITDEPPQAQAVVLIEARPLVG